MKLLVFEYFTAGGSKDNAELRKAGLAMLEALLQDFSQINGLEVWTMLDEVLLRYTSPADLLANRAIPRRASGDNKLLFADFNSSLQRFDAVLILAPETNNLLARFTDLAEKAGKTILGSRYKAVQIVSNKASCLDYLKEQGLPMPAYQVVSPYLETRSDEEQQAFQRITLPDLPAVIKPIYGTGGEGVQIIKTNEQFLDQISSKRSLCRKDKKLQEFLVQDYIEGNAVSVSCLVLDGKVLPLSLNKQEISQEEELLFQGITVPYAHPLAEDIVKSSIIACENIKGLEGFVGVDIIVNSKGPVIIEINARITCAYIALRQVVETNLAEDLWNLTVNRRLPSKPQIKSTYTYNIIANKEKNSLK